LASRRSASIATDRCAVRLTANVQLPVGVGGVPLPGG